MSTGPRAHASWVKSSYSGEAGGCVEMRAALLGVAVRDSKRPDGPVLSCPNAEWTAFIDAVKQGSYRRGSESV
ncbi:DUF397 domain-containing protein [Sphaerisporangium sp. NPDC051017]|uniref:DUF397 domain-containing protein n=1 Tax=Sphaerisporangium sp. NPDC051017 TaxID=3154636 RepID=UPI00342C2A4A